MVLPGGLLLAKGPVPLLGAGGRRNRLAGDLPGGELMATDLAEDIPRRVVGTTPGAEEGGLAPGGRDVLRRGGGGPLLSGGVLVLLGAAAKAPVAFPVVRGATVGADHHIIPGGKGFAANRAAVSGIVRQGINSYRKSKNL